MKPGESREAREKDDCAREAVGGKVESESSEMFPRVVRPDNQSLVGLYGRIPDAERGAGERRSDSAELPADEAELA